MKAPSPTQFPIELVPEEKKGDIKESIVLFFSGLVVVLFFLGIVGYFFYCENDGLKESIVTSCALFFIPSFVVGNVAYWIFNGIFSRLGRRTDNKGQ